MLRPEPELPEERADIITRGTGALAAAGFADFRQ